MILVGLYAGTDWIKARKIEDFRIMNMVPVSTYFQEIYLIAFGNGCTYLNQSRVYLRRNHGAAIRANGSAISPFGRTNEMVK